MNNSINKIDGMTYHQFYLLCFIKDFYRWNKRMPIIKEIQQTLDRLMKRGKLTRLPRGCITYRVSDRRKYDE